MPDFRLYHLNAANRIEQATEIVAETMDEALALAERKRDGRAMELWRRAEKVKVWAPDPSFLPRPAGPGE